MKTLIFAEKLLPRSFSSLYALARETFEESRRYLLLWNGQTWKVLREFDVPDPDVMILGLNGDLWLTISSGFARINPRQQCTEFPEEAAFRRSFSEAIWESETDLLLLAAVYDGEKLTPVGRDVMRFSEAKGLRSILRLDRPLQLPGLAQDSQGSTFLCGRSTLLRLPPQGVPTRIETGVAAEVDWLHIAFATDQSMYLGGGRLLHGVSTDHENYDFTPITLHRRDCFVEQLLAMPDNSMLCVFAGRLLRIRGIAVEDITPPEVEDVACVGAASDCLVVGTLEQGVWVGPPWRQLPPIVIAD